MKRWAGIKQTVPIQLLTQTPGICVTTVYMFHSPPLSMAGTKVQNYRLTPTYQHFLWSKTEVAILTRPHILRSGEERCIYIQKLINGILIEASNLNGTIL